jgi:hypothetical protein
MVKVVVVVAAGGGGVDDNVERKEIGIEWGNQ